MILWALWRAGETGASAELFNTWSLDKGLLQAEPFGLAFLDNAWCKDIGWELDILERLHHLLPLRSLHRLLRNTGWKASAPLSGTFGGLQKVAMLVDTVECVIEPGEPALILAACEDFAARKGQWLKVAGLQKAELLEAGLQGRVLARHESIVEFGVYVGYTAVRLGSLLMRLLRSHMGVVSLEVNPVHVCVARHFLNLGHLASLCEARHGQAQDALALVGEECGGCSAGFSFMDHRGTIFHRDAASMERHALPGALARLVADNTLNPGAPVFLWGLRARAAAWALPEFLAEHEDWTAVVDRPAGPGLV